MKPVRLIVTGVLLGLGVTLVCWAARGGGAQTVRLADGTTFTLLGVQVGKSCTFNFGPPWQRLAAKLPWQWARKYGTRTERGHVSSGTNLVLWVTSPPQKGSLGPAWRYRFAQEAGTNFVQLYRYGKSPLPAGDAVEGLIMDFWPRRARSFRVQACPMLGPADKGAPAWELEVRNPEVLEYPQWRAEVLPGGRTVAGTTFTLESVRVAPGGAERGVAPLRELESLVQARFRMMTAGQPDNDWEILGTQFRDATGNRLQWVGRWTDRRTHSERVAETEFALLPGEEAGKLGVAWLRTRHFDTNDLVELKELPLLGTNGLGTGCAAPSKFGMINVTVRREALEDDFSVSVVNSDPRAGDLAAAGTRWFLPVEAKDNLGHTYAFADAATDMSSLHRVRIRGGAKTLDLKMAAPPLVFVEYTLGRESILPAEKGR